MVNSALQHTDARAVRPYEVGSANFDTPSTTKNCILAHLLHDAALNVRATTWERHHFSSFLDVGFFKPKTFLAVNHFKH